MFMSFLTLLLTVITKNPMRQIIESSRERETEKTTKKEKEKTNETHKQS